MTTPVLELSDRDSDSLTVQVTAEGVWVTCTSGAEEVTVGPLPESACMGWLTGSHVANRKDAECSEFSASHHNIQKTFNNGRRSR